MVAMVAWRVPMQEGRGRRQCGEWRVVSVPSSAGGALGSAVSSKDALGPTSNTTLASSGMLLTTSSTCAASFLCMLQCFFFGVKVVLVCVREREREREISTCACNNVAAKADECTC